jgi:hypothetical protein
MINDNLIYNPSFVSGTTGWAAFTSGSIAAYTADSFVGNGCVKFTKSSTSDDAGVFNAAGYKATVSVGAIYSASAYVKVPTGQETIQVRANFRWYNSGGTFLSGVSGTLTTITSTDGWVRLITENATAPASSAFADVVIYQDAGTKTVGNYFLVDAVKIEASAFVTPFVEPLDQNHENNAVNNTLRKVPVPHITGMELAADIMLNGLLLNTVDENNCVWVCTNIVGWWDLPDPEVPDMTRGLDDGSYDVRGRYTGRNMTLEGSILVPDRTMVPTVRAKLIEAINLVHTGGWLYVDEDPTKAAYVRLSGRPNIEVVNPRGRINFSVGLRAANPVKFKWNWNDLNGYETTTVTNQSSATITNSGNIDVPMILTLSGGTAGLTAPITITNSTSGDVLKLVKTLRGSDYSTNISSSVRTGYVVTLTSNAHGYLEGDVVTISGVTTSGRTTLNQAGVTITSVTTNTITYTSSTTGTLAELATNGAIGLDVTDSLEIDTYNKSALFNGSATYARSYIDAQAAWVTLQPGSNTIVFADNGGTTNLTIKHRSGWIG